jgi:metal-dependent amidase/aminoacylase/carboxypeptidase family protein
MPALLADQSLAEVVEWRRDLHAHPELQFEVNRTASLVTAKLKEFGCDEVVTGVGRSGVVGVIRDKRQTSGRAIGLRADMDALPIDEETGVSYHHSAKMHRTAHSVPDP